MAIVPRPVILIFLPVTSSYTTSPTTFKLPPTYRWLLNVPIPANVDTPDTFTELASIPPLASTKAANVDTPETFAPGRLGVPVNVAIPLTNKLSSAITSALNVETPVTTKSSYSLGLPLVAASIVFWVVVSRLAIFFNCLAELITSFDPTLNDPTVEIPDIYK